MILCKACRREILPTASLWTLESKVSFEIILDYRIPFHLPLCSEVCLEAMKRREAESLHYASRTLGSGSGLNL